MSHPPMFDDDPYLARVRALAAGFPGSAEKVPHGRPAFHTQIAELLDASFRLTAPERVIGELDARAGTP